MPKISRSFASHWAICYALRISISPPPARLRILESRRQVRVIDAHTPFPVHFHVLSGTARRHRRVGQNELDLIRDAVPTLPPLRSYRSSAVGLRPLSARALVDEASSATFHITSGGFMFVRTARRDRWFEAHGRTRSTSCGGRINLSQSVADLAMPTASRFPARN